MLCESLLRLARLGVNVTAVLHQPKTEIFGMFDTGESTGLVRKTIVNGHLYLSISHSVPVA